MMAAVERLGFEEQATDVRVSVGEESRRGVRREVVILGAVGCYAVRAARMVRLHAAAPAVGSRDRGRVDHRERGEPAEGVDENQPFHVSLACFHARGRAIVERRQPRGNHGRGGEQGAGRPRKVWNMVMYAELNLTSSEPMLCASFETFGRRYVTANTISPSSVPRFAISKVDV